MAVEATSLPPVLIMLTLQPVFWRVSQVQNHMIHVGNRLYALRDVCACDIACLNMRTTAHQAMNTNLMKLVTCDQASLRVHWNDV